MSIRSVSRLLLLVSCVCALLAPGAGAAPSDPVQPAAAPKLVLVLVVDGLPYEQLQRYRDQYDAKGGLRRLLDGGASFSNAHQAHGITVTAIGHSAVLTGAYPYRHGIIGNNWLDAAGNKVYCTEDTRYHYIGESTDPHEGTSPANLRVDTLGDQLRYASGNRSKVVTVSGKDRGAILLAGKTGTAYMAHEKTLAFSSSTFYMAAHPEWVERFRAARPQERYRGKSWEPLLADAAYADDTPFPAATKDSANRLPLAYDGLPGAKPESYYKRLRESPALDELTLEFARAAVDGERLGANPSGATDLLGVSLSAHDLVNHKWGPESRMSHDHLQRLDRMLGGFFDFLDQRVGMDNVLVVLTADHGFANSAEFSRARHIDARRIPEKPLLAALDAALAKTFGVQGLVVPASLLPDIRLNVAAAAKKGVARADLEDAAARFLLEQPGIAQVFARTQLERGIGGTTRLATLMQRAWHRQLSGDLLLVPAAYTAYGTDESGATHGTPHAYDTQVPLLFMGPRWIRPGMQPQYTEVVDIAPTLSHLLRVRQPAGSEGRVLAEALR
jgi:hypothetical protein